MLTLYNVDVLKTRTDRHEIMWDARPSSTFPLESVDDYNFKILWSFDPVDDFNDLGITIDGAVGPLFYLHDLKHTPHDRKHYYKIRSILKTDSSVYNDSQSVYVGDEYDGVLETIRYAEEILYDMYIGEPVYLSKKKEGQGSRCPDCWNPLQFKRTKGKCNTCHGTGFFDGFFAPIEIQMAFDSNPKVTNIPIQGETDTKFIKARASNYPIINNRDMITNKDDYRRWVVTNVDITKLPNRAASRQLLSRSNYIVSQMLTLAELDPDDPKYGVILVGQDARGTGSPDTLDLSASGDGDSYGTGGNIESDESEVSGSGIKS